MALDRRSPENSEQVERVEGRADPASGSVGDPWSKSDMERDQGFADARQAVRDHLAENPRTTFGRDSEAVLPADDAPPVDEGPDEAEELAKAERRVGELRVEGHGPQRHLDVSDDQLHSSAV